MAEEQSMHGHWLLYLTEGFVLIALVFFAVEGVQVIALVLEVLR